MIHLSKQQRLIVDALAERFGRLVYGDKLVSAVYGARYDGGPLQPANNISVLICLMRPKLASVGLAIRGVKGGAGRRLVWAP